MSTEDFLPATDHFARLVDTLPDETRLLYNSMRHVRVETAFKDRVFVLYRVGAGGAKVVDRLKVLDFDCTHEEGASTSLISTMHEGKGVLVLGYKPQRVFDYNLFMWLPLSAKIRWATSDMKRHSLAFPLVIRTQSRHHLRETGVLHCETRTAFAKEFKDSVVD